MTTYCIREQIFTLGDRFHIMDETGTVCFIAEGELFSFGRKLHLYRAAGDDAIGEEVAFIEQEIVLFSRPRYRILSADSAAFTVVSEFSFFSRAYSVPERGWHQYMTDVTAPLSDARGCYKAHAAGGTLDSAIEFVIPVFD